jgi:phosphoribosylformimino-5-aminoimidazole carboxamide ribotide isomerase
MLLIPSIDLRDGHCVRLLRGDFAAETRYELEPHELLARYRQLGASWLHIVDLDAARDGSQINRNLVYRLAAQRGVQLQVGGGVRDAAGIEQLLAHGVGRVVIGSAAVERAHEVRGWLERYGAQRLCLAFDVRHDTQGVPRVRTRGWQQESSLSLWEAVEAYEGSGLTHVLCTDIERDGALAGPNVSLYTEALRRFPRILWQASGGVSSGADLRALAASGVPAAISGKALLEERLTLQELQPFLPNA